MKVKKEFIGSKILVPNLGIMVLIEENQAEKYWKLGLFHVIEKNYVAIKKKRANKRSSNSN
jgi:hypothetical protein